MEGEEGSGGSHNSSPSPPRQAEESVGEETLYPSPAKPALFDQAFDANSPSPCSTSSTSTGANTPPRSDPNTDNCIIDTVDRLIARSPSHVSAIENKSETGILNLSDAKGESAILESSVDLDSDSERGSLNRVSPTEEELRVASELRDLEKQFKEDTEELAKQSQSPSRTDRPAIPFWKKLLFHGGKMELAALISLFLMFFSILLQSYGKVRVHKLDRRSAPRAIPFFSSSSPVMDHFRGQGADATSLMSNSELTFLMYYAPWCAHCQDMRWQLDQLASHFPPNQIQFAAVNCWDPGGRCRRLYKLYTYPVMAVYPASTQAVFYSGPFSADYIYKFLEGVLNPLQRLQSKKDVLEFASDSDISVIGFFDFGAYSHPPGYLNYHMAAVRALEKDPLRYVKFGVVTQRDLAQSVLQMQFNKEIRIYSLSSPNFIPFPHRERSFKAAEIVRWVFQSVERWEENKPAAFWIPNGEQESQKSEQIQGLLSRGGPTAILFTPRHPLWESEGPSAGYASFRSAALEYLDCTDPDLSESPSRPARARAISRRKAHRRRELIGRLRNNCRDLARRQKQLKDCCHDVVLTSVTVAPHRNICEVCLSKSTDGAPNAYFGKAKGEVVPPTVLPVIGVDIELGANSKSAPHSVILKKAVSTRSCHGFEQYLSAPALVDYCCHSSLSTAENNPDADLRRSLVDSMTSFFAGNSSPNLLSPSDSNGKCNKDSCSSETKHPFSNESVHAAKSLADSCKKLRLSKLLNYDIGIENTSQNVTEFFDAYFPETDDPEIRGLSCRTNLTLSFAAIDIRQYGWIRRRIIGTADFKSKSTTPQNHSLDTTLVIVDNATESVYLMKHRPPTLDNIRDFIYNFTNGLLRPHLRNEDLHEPGFKAKPHHRSAVDTQDTINLLQVTTNTFHSVVLNPRKDVVLFYTGGRWCGLCQGVYHAILNTAAYFRGLEDRLIFAQVDSSRNDLEVPYTVDRYPSLIFYPSNRKTESSAYPTYLPYTLPNLISFVLAHSHPEVRWRVALGICNSSCMERNRFNVARRLSVLRTDIRLMKGRLTAILEQQFKDTLFWQENEINLKDVYLHLLRKEILRQELQRRTLRSFLRLLTSMKNSTNLLIKMKGREALMLEWMLRNEWFLNEKSKLFQTRPLITAQTVE